MDVAAYLQRIGYDGPLDPDDRTLAALQRAHLLSVPFDALDCLLGNPVTVEPEDAYRKVVEQGRGGYCFELNGLFAWLLEELGFAVARVAAQPAIGDDRFAEPDAHLALIVDTGTRRLVDVGFGSFAIEPLALDDDGEQVRGDRRFRVMPESNGLLAEELGVASPNAYWLSPEPVAQTFFAERCRAYSTKPDSPFVRNGTVQQLFDDGWMSVKRTALAGERGATTYDRPIADEADWRAELERWFGLVVDGSQVRRVG